MDISDTCHTCHDCYDVMMMYSKERYMQNHPKIVAKWLEEEEMVDKRGCEGVEGNKLIIVSVYHMTRLPLIFSTGLGMTL